MFTINYRIEAADEFYNICFNDINDIYGDMVIYVNSSAYGIYTDEYGSTYFSGNDVLDYWFRYLLDAVKCIRKGTACAISEPDVFGSYLSFEPDGSDVRISCKSFCSGRDEFVAGVIDGDAEWSENVPLAEFEKEIITKAEMFVNELLSIDERFAKGKRIEEIISAVKS